MLAKPRTATPWLAATFVPVAASLTTARMFHSMSEHIEAPAAVPGTAPTTLGMQAFSAVNSALTRVPGVIWSTRSACCPRSRMRLSSCEYNPITPAPASRPERNLRTRKMVHD